MLDVTTLQPGEEVEYEAVLRTNKHSLLYSSIKYRDFLRKVTGSEACYLVARREGQIVGMLPAFLKRNPDYGNVLNSLPFFGSNGGATCGADTRDKEDVKRLLIEAFHDLANEENVILSTIITSPFEDDIAVYENPRYYDYKDHRIGQVTPLPAGKDDEEIDEALTAAIDSVRRRNIRKAQKETVTYRHSGDIDDLVFLAEVHKQNIQAIGGRAKDWSVFQAIHECFEYDDDYRVYVAEFEGQRIAALLIFYHNLTVEYFCPATVHEYRNFQPNSLLIYQAMKDTARMGYAHWNWGGTWPSQDSLYDFKKRWGTKDYPYTYYTKKHRDDSHILSLEEAEIANEFPYFYVVPFSELVKGS